MLYLATLFLASIAFGQKEECGRSCLMPCRMIAIKCVQEGIKPQEFPKLMGCVYDKTIEDDYRNERYNGDTCKECIDGELKERSFAEKAECLERGDVDSCSPIEDPSECNALEKSQNCGWIAGKCYMRKDKINYQTYEKMIVGLKGDDKVCGMMGGRFRDGKCRAKPAKKVRCGHINKKKHHKKDQTCDSCKHLCNWMPNCRFKMKNNRCSGKQNPFTDN